MITANEPITSEAKCSASAASAWLSGLARGAVQGAGAPEIDDDVDHQHDERHGRNGRRRGSLAQPAVGLDQDAAGKHVEQGGHTERRDALQLAVAVMVLLVGRLVGHPHHSPGDDGRDQVDRGVQGLGDQRERADRDADRELGRRHAAAGEDGDRGDRGFAVLGGHGGGFSSLARDIK
ncbi:hypothetical protein ABH978_006394 [Bradyrhizobium ottawaense]